MQGIKVAQQGTNVATAADYQLIASTQWPLLTIVAQGAFSLPQLSGSDTAVIYEHDLGYTPAFIIYNTGPQFPNANLNQQGQSAIFDNSNVFKTDNNKLYMTAGYANTFKGYFYIFKQDLNAVINPTTAFGVPAQSTGSSSFGIEVAQKGETIQPGQLTSASNLHPMVIHMMGQVGTVDGSVLGSATIVHNLGYFPIVLLYDMTGGTAAFLEHRATAQLTSVSITGVQSALPATVAYIVLKDPLFQGDTT